MADGGEPELRLFAAVGIPEEQRRSLVRAVGLIKSELPARWVRSELWHMTLKFFGEVREERLPEITQAIAGVAGAVRPIESALLDLGAFPSPARARVLWVGLADPEERLRALAEGVEAACRLEPEGRFSPHLTLARFKEPHRLTETIDRWSPLDIDRSLFHIEQVTLFRSVLRREGAEYHSVGVFPLSGS